MSYKCKHFKIHELVPPDIYNKLGEKAWRLLDPELLKMLDLIKEKFPKGTMTINNYFWGGDRKYSGVRNHKSGHYYSTTSMHTFGRAYDIIFSDYYTNDVRNYIMEHQEEFEHITRIEDDVSWLHCDSANTESENIVLFKP